MDQYAEETTTTMNARTVNRALLIPVLYYAVNYRSKTAPTGGASALAST
jgi:hypothetical protein